MTAKIRKPALKSLPRKAAARDVFIAKAIGVPEWPVAGAKARFSELIEKCAASPQTITRNGKPVAVVVGIEEWKRRSARKGSLLEFFQSAPEGFADLDISRAPELPRDINL